MTGNAVETNFVSPHMASVFGGGDEKINLAATIITLYSLASLIGSYLAGAFSDLWGPQRVMLLGLVVWLVKQQDRKSTRLNSSHVAISYAVFCLKKKK